MTYFWLTSTHPTLDTFLQLGQQAAVRTLTKDQSMVKYVAFDTQAFVMISTLIRRPIRTSISDQIV